MGQIADLRASAVAAVVAAGYIDSPAAWSAQRVPATAADRWAVVRIDSVQAAGRATGLQIQQATASLTVGILSAGAGSTGQAAALDHVEAIANALDALQPGAAPWAECRWIGATLSEVDASWIVCESTFEVSFTFVRE